MQASSKSAEIHGPSPSPKTIGVDLANRRYVLLVQVLQHVPFEGPAAIGEWAREHRHELTTTRAFAGEALPDPAGFDLLVIMGGPMSVNDAETYPWIPAEIRLIETSLRHDKSLLGVCLGAQLMAAALGTRVHRASEKEIGWYPVRLTPEAHTDSLLAGAPETFVPLHWHGETFDLPAGCTRLAETDVCANQAFQVGRNALALQFHVESTEASVRTLVEACAHEITAGPFQQAATDILMEVNRTAKTRPILFDALDRLEAARSA